MVEGSEAVQYLTVDPNTNPMAYYVAWVVSDFWSNPPNDFSYTGLRCNSYTPYTPHPLNHRPSQNH